MKILMRWFAILSLLLFSWQCFASKMVFGEGRFYSQDEDSLSFCKKQLLFSAFQNVISSELTAMGHDSKLFWQQFDEKYDKNFEPIEKSLKRKYRIDETPEEAKGKRVLSDAKLRKNKESYTKQLRYRRLKSKTRYKNVAGVIAQYKVKKMTRSTQYPNSRYLSLYAKVNRQKLNKTYYGFTHVGKIKKFKNLYISTSFNLNGASWSDIGVEVLNEFEETIQNHWRKWFEGALGNYVENVIVANDSQNRKLEEFFKLSKNAQESVELVAKSESTGPFPYSMWIQVNINIKKRSSNSLQGTRGYSFSGDYVILDLSDYSLIDHFDFTLPTQNFSTETDRKLRSSVATAIYSIPLEKFSTIKGKLSKVSVHRNTLKLTVKNIDKLTTIFRLEKLLISKGITLQLKPRLEKYNGIDASLNLDFIGKVDRVNTLLKSFKGVELGNYAIEILDEANPLIFSVVKIDEGSDDA
ncbi:MAG: hypothetical protein KAG61_02725 [Bacteriovoracaceae bacterium]|nr:hypothetical protein [Bacteriovoracaceae bacterium]